MNYDSQTIERIVTEVMRRVASLPDPAAGSSTNAPSASPAPPAPAPQSPPSDALVLEAQVVTTNTIHGRLKGVRRVVVGQRAVITPSVRDELQKNNIRLERREPNHDAATVANSTNLTVVRCAAASDAAARTMTALSLPNGAAEQRCSDLPTAVSYSMNAVQNSGDGSVLITDQSLAAVCLLNRSPQVRAAPARTMDDVREAVSAIGVNVLVVDPRRMTANQWNVIVDTFRKDWPHPCPPQIQTA